METYIVENIKYTVPTEQDIKMIKVYSQCDFANPEALLDTWLYYSMLHGPLLIYRMIEHFKTLSDADMPKNYINDFIEEFSERLETEKFVIKNNRFKLIRRHDNVSKAFRKEVNIRNENYSIIEDILINNGYNKKEIMPALNEAINLVHDVNDVQQILNKVLKILSKIADR